MQGLQTYPSRYLPEEQEVQERISVVWQSKHEDSLKLHGMQVPSALTPYPLTHLLQTA
jgi:hypothetical protein